MIDAATCQLFLIVLVSLLALVVVDGDELTNVWHYDFGVTRISEPPGNNRGNTPPKVGESQQAEVKLNEEKISANQTTSSTDDQQDQEVCDFHGRTLRVAVSPQPPFVNCLQDLYGDWLCNGSNIELIHVLEQRFNFVADWVVLANSHLDDDTFGLNRKASASTGGRRVGGQQVALARQRQLAISRGELNQSVATMPPTFSNVPKQMGIFSLVSTGRVLLSANGVMKSIDRSGQKLIVSAPFDSFKLHFLLSKSVRDHDHIFIKPFDPKAWLTILCSAALIVPIFYFINTTTSYYNALDDRPLNRVSLRQCWQHTRQAMARRLVRVFLAGRASQRSLSLSSTDALLDREITRMMELSALSDKAAQREPPLPTIDTIESSYAKSMEVALRVAPPPAPLIKFENSRKQRLARQQWARERKRARKASKLKRKSGFFNAAYVIWYVVASLANQGGETEDLPRANSTRILIAFWWLYMIVICAIHSGILTAILTFPKQIDFIQTLDDYLNLEPSERDSIHLTVDKFGELAQLLSDTDNLHKSPLQELQKQHVPISYVNFQRNRQRILDEVQLGRSAFIEERSFITQVITREYYDSRQTKCLFKASRYPISVIPMSLILSDKMPPACVRALNALLERIMKTGLAQKWRRKYEASGNDCLNTVVINAGDVDQIELKHVELAFWLLTLGAFVGLLFLITEIVWLFTIDDEDLDDDLDDEEDTKASSTSLSSEDNSLFSTSSSSSSSLSLGSTISDESDRVKLGFRRTLESNGNQPVTIRSLESRRIPVRMMLRKSRRNRKRANAQKITFTLNDAEMDSERKDSQQSNFMLAVDEKEGLREVKEFYSSRQREKRVKRAAKEAEKRAKRLRKTVNLVKKIHGGKMYSERLKKRIRRMSHSVANHLQARGSTAIITLATGANNLVRRRGGTSERSGQVLSGGRGGGGGRRIAPIES